MSAPDRIRTDALKPGDRVWHPFDIVCFTVAHKPKPETGLHFQGERGLRVTGTSDRGETVHVDVAPGYTWLRGPDVAAAEKPDAAAMTPPSAPVTHDPLVVNTADGTVWQRRAVTPDGRGLYAVTGSCSCPEYLMATLAELAEHGIAGSAYALPVPVGSPLEQALDQLAGVSLSLWEEEQDTARLRLAWASAQRGRRKARAEVASLRDERHTTNEALDDVVRGLREREAAPLTVFRASHDSIVMGLYTTPAEARKHCENVLRREYDESTKVSLWWRDDEGNEEQPQDGEVQLIAHVTPRGFPKGRTWYTGYVVTTVAVSASYDEEADE